MIVSLGNTSIDRFLGIHIWLTTTIPVNDWSWIHEVGYDAVEFKNEEDAIAFKLKYPTI
jgi:hypothetical protein